MRVSIEFDSLEEALPFLQATYPTRGIESVAPPVDNAHVAPGTEQFSEPEKPKRTRRTKAEMEAAKAAETPAEEPAAPTGDFDDEPVTQSPDFLEDEPAAKVLTKDDVRAALVTYQERLAKAGKGVEDARATVLALLKKVSGADKLGQLADDKFAAVIDAANKAK